MYLPNLSKYATQIVLNDIIYCHTEITNIENKYILKYDY